MWKVTPGTTSYRGFRIRILDATTGAPYTSATSATAGASFGYTRPGSTRTSISLSDLAAVDSAYSSGGIKHIGSGWYRLDVPDAAIAAGVDGVLIDGAFTSYVVVCPPILLETTQTGDSFARIGALGAGLTAVGDTAGTTTLLTRITALIQTKAEADTAHGLLATAAKMLSYFQSALRSDVTVDTDIGGSYDDATDSQQAIRDRGDAAWTTASAPSAATIADAVWDEVLSGHATAGTAGAALSTAGAAADPLENTVPGSYASGTAGHALGRIGSGQINTRSTVAQGGNIEEIIGGATYASADGLSFDWTDADNSWPTLTAATVTWIALFGGTVYSKAMSVVTATGSSKKVRLELTASETAALQTIGVGVWTFMVWATLSGGSVVPLVGGTARVKNPPGPS